MRATRNIYIMCFVVMTCASCGNESSTTDAHVEVEEVMEAIEDKVEQEQRLQEVEKEIEELADDQKEAYKEQLIKDEEKKKEKIAESPLKAFALDPQGLVDHLNDKVVEATPQCKVTELFDYLTVCGDDPIFKAISKNPEFEEAIESVYTKAFELKGNCKNP